MTRLISLLVILTGMFFAVTAFYGDEPADLRGNALADLRPVVSRAPEAEPPPAPLSPAVQRIAESASPSATMFSGPVVLNDVAPSDAMLALSAAENPAVIIPGAAGSGTTASYLQVTARSANVRGGPSTRNPVLGRLNQGDEVAVIEDNGTGWLRIRIEGDGVEGWISRNLLSN